MKSLSYKLKILIVHNHYQQRGGEDSVFETECAMLRGAGHTVICYEKHNDEIPGARGENQQAAPSDSPSSKLRPRAYGLTPSSLKSKIVNLKSKIALCARTIWNFETYREITEIIQREKPDIVHCHNTFPLISPSVYWAAARQGVPVVQTLHNYRLVCINPYLYRNDRICEDCLGRSPIRGVFRRCYRGSFAASLPGDHPTRAKRVTRSTSVTR